MEWLVGIASSFAVLEHSLLGFGKPARAATQGQASQLRLEGKRSPISGPGGKWGGD